MMIHENEGHGRFDNKIESEPISNVPICRFNYPQFPMDETTLIPGISNLEEDEVKKRKSDLRKIRKYLVRQTGFAEGNREDNKSWQQFKKLTFNQFLRNVGMYEDIEEDSTSTKFDIALKRYKEAISAHVKGSGAVFIKRNPEDVFTNNYNRYIMEIHEANHDLQMVTDPYACAEYICDYLTKGEAGVSKLLQEINNENKDLSQMELLNKLASTLDKHREVSIQEAVYRLLGLPMVKSSVKVKYINTSHPDKRDGMLKSNLEELEDDESPFMNNAFKYYENRPRRTIKNSSEGTTDFETYVQQYQCNKGENQHKYEDENNCGQCTYEYEDAPLDGEYELWNPIKVHEMRLDELEKINAYEQEKLNLKENELQDDASGETEKVHTRKEKIIKDIALYNTLINGRNAEIKKIKEELPRLKKKRRDYDIESWDEMCLADFWSCYEIAYGKKKKNRSEDDIDDTTERFFIDRKLGFVKIRSKRAILRYFLKFENEEDMCRAELILFSAFQKEMEEIHQHDIFEKHKEKKDQILKNKKKFDENKAVTQIIDNIQKEREERQDDYDGESENEFEFEETTSASDIKDFEKDADKWMRKKAINQLSCVKQFTSVIHPDELKKLINGLNSQQRKIFDDLIERETCSKEEKTPYFVFIAGEAGTGKSYLTRVLMEAFKSLNVKSGDELNKPHILAIAPTANAAYIIKGKTIESALRLSGTNYSYQKLTAESEADLKYLYEDVSAIFIDEISMVGAGKLTKINFRFQDIASGSNKKEFMGGRSCIVTGDMFQLPPVKDNLIFKHSKLDGRPQCAPSHWNEHFSIYYMTEKMRSQKDTKFGEVCDRIAQNIITEDDENYLREMIRPCPHENDNEMFREGKISIIVTTNDKREHINKEKLQKLLPDEDEVSNIATDHCTNQNDAPLPSDTLNYTQTGNLPQKVILKVGAPILITTNDPKYKEDGIVNGAKGYIDSFQFYEQEQTKVKVIWVVFKDETVGRRLRMEKKELKGSHHTNSQSATPIEITKASFQLKNGNLKYRRSQFPMILGYAITAHKSQGDSLEEIVIDFSHKKKEKKGPFIIEGSFYVAITRASGKEHVYLRDFDRSYIKVKADVAENMDAMRKTRPYKMKKIYNDDPVFEDEGNEVKIGYLNINGLRDAGHYEYLNNDKNLLHLDLICLAETKLSRKETSDEELRNLLSEYDLIKRCDSEDSMKHMGMLIMCPKKSK